MKYFFLVSFIMLTVSSVTSITPKEIVQKQSEDKKDTIKFHLTVDKEKGSNWWAGIIGKGQNMPFQKCQKYETYGVGYGNQIQPLILSSNGDVIWSEEPLKINVQEQEINVTSTGEITHTKGKGSLRDGFLYASRTYFPPSGKLPDELLFAAPQYNTWIELIYDQNEKDILKYAQSLINNDFPPGVFMIDDNWQEDYGKWKFHEGRFNDPKDMINKLHQMGFKVMIWVCPFVSPDCDIYRELSSKDYFLKNKTGEPAIVRWWNGASALLDLSNPEAMKWFKGQLQYLVDEYGVDGFKLDAGDARFYTGDVELNGMSPNYHSYLYGQVGLDYPLNEYRAMWKMGGQPLAERLQDKHHTWGHLNLLIPQMLVEGIMGYPFSCPDLIGGGNYISFINDATIDQELIVRSAQCHALMPMMQFSVAPWRILDKEHLSAVKEAVTIRQKYKDLILKLAREAAITGEPIMRPMEYNYPHQGFASIVDQFMLGDSILVAPVLEKGARKREVVLPEGKWETSKGKVLKGGTKYVLRVELEDLLYFYKKN